MPSPSSPSISLEKLANKTGKTVQRAPAWAKGGTLVYRVATTDDPDVLRFTEEGLAIVHSLLDDSIRQIPILNGVIGEDHPGAWNWDGLWPYWNRVSFRARDWATLHGFMSRAKEQSNATPSFHVNLTDVNAGLRDYPETRDFFKKLAATGSIYRRDGHLFWPNVYANPAPPHERDLDPPYVLREIPEEAHTIEIVALVNYKNFWDSGLAKEMIDDFYRRLPFAPPLLYLDVLTLSGSNFSTGFPDGPLGGSEATQLEGVRAITDYIRSKGTDIATEGDRPPLMGNAATYGWLHCTPGVSADDYSYIAGATRYLPVQHVAGNTGCFVLSPIASTACGLDRVREHYARLLAGSPGSKAVPGLATCHVAHPVSTNADFNVPGLVSKWSDPFSGTDFSAVSEFDIPGAGDPFRGDWADLVNNFYLTGIQELYHIGKGNVRQAVFNKNGLLYLTRLSLIDPAGRETAIPAVDFAPADRLEAVQKPGRLLLEKPLGIRFDASQAGEYQIKIHGFIPGHDHASLNLYVNGCWQRTINEIQFPQASDWDQEFALGAVTLNAGENTIGLDAGPIFMQWSDGTTALWSTPFLNKGFCVTDGDVTFADDYDRMWPDTWSGQKKIYFFSWDGASRAWKLPQDWATVQHATLYPLTPGGRGQGVLVAVADRSFSPKLLPQVPYVLVA